VTWTIARWTALAAVPLLLAWLVLAPATALTALWYVAIPALPATFLVSTALWRGICPLGTLNEVGNRLGRQREPGPRLVLGLNIAGLVLFHLMVPARHFVFNANGPALAAAVAVVGGLAAGLGALFTVRSGFCNALCPVLPVELLYGQAPLISMNRGRCSTCTMCTPRGCLDLAGQKAVNQVLGPSRHSARWLVTPHGVFFAALPGFVIGYNQVKDGPLGGAAMVYATTLGWSLASLVAVALLVLALRLHSRVVLPLLAAAAGALYYWYAGPAITTHLGAGHSLGEAIRIAGIGVVATWLVRALPRAGAEDRVAEAGGR
jgi:hypothetical protein